MDRVIVGFYGKTAIPIESHFWRKRAVSNALVSLISSRNSSLLGYRTLIKQHNLWGGGKGQYLRAAGYSHPFLIGSALIGSAVPLLGLVMYIACKQTIYDKCDNK